MVQCESILTDTQNFYDPYVIIGILPFFSQIQVLYVPMVNEIESGCVLGRGCVLGIFPYTLRKKVLKSNFFGASGCHK